MSQTSHAPQQPDRGSGHGPGHGSGQAPGAGGGPGSGAAPNPGYGSGPGGEDRRHMIKRRFLTALIIVLLIGIPAGYLVISGGQSRDSGRDKARKAAATGLHKEWPSRVQRRIYDLPVPLTAVQVHFYESNNWRTSRLYMQFQLPDQDLDVFLAEMGVSRSALKDGAVTIGGHDRKVAGWTFTPDNGKWSGLTHPQKQPLPTQDIMVNTSNPAFPTVFAVSTTTP